MPKRKLVSPNNDLQTNRLLADLGRVFDDDVARLFFLALTNEAEIEYLCDYLASLVRAQNTAGFRKAADTFQYVVKRLKSNTPYDLTRSLQGQYEEKHGKRGTAAGLANYLKGAGIGRGETDQNSLSYARELRRQWGSARRAGRPRIGEIR